MYDRGKIELADNRFKPKNAPVFLKGNREFFSYHDRNIKYNSPQFHKTARHGYYACVSYADALVGKLLTTLDELALGDNTIVVISGDHGWHLGEHNFWSKMNLLHNATRAPLIVSVPGFNKNIKTDGIVELVDIYPTLCELADIELPKHLEGTSMVPLMRDPKRPWKKAAFIRCRNGSAVVTRDYTYTEYVNKQRMLFDRRKDPAENENVAAAAEYRETVKQLSKLLADGWEKVQEPPKLKKDAGVEKARPNVLLIAVDDLNDWIGCMGGHPQAKTPNMDRLAARGVLFTNTQCQSPVCNPSRASLMTSLYPSTSGIYFLNPDLKQSPVAAKSKLMPQRFVDEGYYVTAAGKLFHGNQSAKYIPNYGGLLGGFGPMPKKKISSFPGHPLWDWGAYPERDDQMPDHKIASWAQKQLAKKHDQPIWMGVGFLRPHVPQFAPQKWFDMYPLDTLQLPKIVDNDLNDISQYGISITRLKHVAPTHEWVTKNKQWKPLVQSYLACVSFVDAQVGRVLDALEKSDCADNTYIVLFTDHGFHIGEKERHAKRSLWEDGTRTPMIIVGPGIAKGKVCNKPTQLLDIYPTLLELTGHKADPSHEGNSLVPILKNPNADWPHMARTSFGPGNYAIVSEGYRYIRYNDGTEEFYDRKNDPHEWNNIIESPSMAAEIQKHRKFLPKKTYRIMGKGSTGHKSYQATEAARQDPVD